METTSEGRKVTEAGHLSRKDKEKMKLRCWPLTGKEQHTIKAVQELLDTEYPAWYDIGAGGAKHDYVCVDYWVPSRTHHRCSGCYCTKCTKLQRMTACWNETLDMHIKNRSFFSKKASSLLSWIGTERVRGIKLTKELVLPSHIDVYRLVQRQQLWFYIEDWFRLQQ
jgi:hypothetical protein